MSPRYEHESAAAEEVAAAFALPGASGAVAVQGANIAGFLLGAPKASPVWGSNVWVDAAGQAVAEPELVRDMYGLAAAPVRTGSTILQTAVIFSPCSPGSAEAAGRHGDGQVVPSPGPIPRGISMTLYMYQASYTAKSMAAQLTDPHDPMEAIRPTLQELGATIVVAGFPFGEYDVLIVYEAPDDVTAASVAMAVAAAGEVKSAKTTRLLSGQEWLESLRKRKIVTTRKVRQLDDHQRPLPESR